MAQEAYERFASYDWDKDEAFQTGLGIFLGRQNIPSGSPQAQSVEARYKFFYFSKHHSFLRSAHDHRRFGTIDRDGFDQWTKSRDTAVVATTDKPASGASEQERPDLSRPWFQQIPSRISAVSVGTPDELEEKGPSFDEIVELIQSGKPIPGIRQIPDQLSSETPSTSSAATRKKPWEK